MIYCALDEYAQGLGFNPQHHKKKRKKKALRMYCQNILAVINHLFKGTNKHLNLKYILLLYSLFKTKFKQHVSLCLLL